MGKQELNRFEIARFRMKTPIYEENKCSNIFGEEISDNGKNQKMNKKKLSRLFRNIHFYRIVGILSYLNVPSHAFSMGRNLVLGDLLVISLRFVTHADHDGLISLIAFVKEIEAQGI